MNLKNLNRKKVTDTILKSGIVTFGNLNDQINCMTKCAPNLPAEVMDEIFTALQGLGVQDGDRLAYELTDERSKEHLYEYPIANMVIAFTKIV